MKSELHTLSEHVPLAQRIARWTSNPKVLGSIPRWDEHDFFFPLDYLSFSPRYKHVKGDVRMAEWSKAPDSRFNPCFLIGSEYEISGPLMRAGVRIPFLTKTFFISLMKQCKCKCNLSTYLHDWGYSSVVEHPAAIR